MLHPCPTHLPVTFSLCLFQFCSLCSNLLLHSNLSCVVNVKAIFFCHLCKNEFDQLVWQLKDPHLSPLFLSSIQYTNRVYLHGMFYCSLLINNLLQERHGFIMGLWCAVDGWEKKTHTSESKLSPETWLAFLLKISCRSVYWSTTTWHFIISERAQH